jgi:hypothetical protein
VTQPRTNSWKKVSCLKRHTFGTLYQPKLERATPWGVRHGWNLVHSTQKSTEIKPEIKKSREKLVNFEIRNHWNFVIIEPTVLYDSGNSQKSGNRVKNQEIRLEITLEIKKSHYKSTEIRLEINRNQIRNQEIRFEIAWFRTYPLKLKFLNNIILTPEFLINN